MTLTTRAPWWLSYDDDHDDEREDEDDHEDNGFSPAALFLQADTWYGCRWKPGQCNDHDDDVDDQDDAGILLSAAL